MQNNITKDFSDLDLIKKICDKNCGECSLFGTYLDMSRSCILEEPVYDWDLSAIKSKLNMMVIKKGLTL